VGLRSPPRNPRLLLRQWAAPGGVEERGLCLSSLRPLGGRFGLVEVLRFVRQDPKTGVYIVSLLFVAEPDFHRYRNFSCC
jgi:hypothetical protein